jgi:hypothetical protein
MRAKFKQVAIVIQQEYVNKPASKVYYYVLPHTLSMVSDYVEALTAFYQTRIDYALLSK